MALRPGTAVRAAGQTVSSEWRARMVRFGVLFPVCLILGFGIVVAPFGEPWVKWFTGGLVTVCAQVIRLFGGQVLAYDRILRSPLNGFSVLVEYGCNGVNVTVLLWAAVLAFPATWAQKGKGLLIGTLTIQGLNMLRIISLFYLGQVNQGWFDFAHLYLWESLLVLDTVVVFWIWVQAVQRTARKVSA
jgi:exosortase H (IPTLxxWG-CTERM-specific)